MTPTPQPRPQLHLMSGAIFKPENIRAVRLGLEMSQAEFLRALGGVPQARRGKDMYAPDVSRWERGLTDMSGRYCARYLDLLCDYWYELPLPVKRALIVPVGDK